MHDPLPDPTRGVSAEAECKAPQNDGTTVQWTVLLNPAGLAFDAPPGVPLLQAAEQAGIDMPSSCRNGTCRTCLCQLLAGAVTHLVDWPGLSAEEKADGFILPCVALAQSDLTILQPHARALFDH